MWNFPLLFFGMAKLGGGGIVVGSLGGEEGGPPAGGLESWASATSQPKIGKHAKARILVVFFMT